MEKTITLLENTLTQCLTQHEGAGGRVVVYWRDGIAHLWAIAESPQTLHLRAMRNAFVDTLQEADHGEVQGL